VEATQKALQDAKLTKEQIDSVVYSIFSETVLRQQIATQPLQDAIGMGNKKSLRVEADAANSLPSG
jgi:3-oxoacyl-[acyl-carrier-protein] synthase III